MFIQVDSNLWILLGCVLVGSSIIQREATLQIPDGVAPKFSGRRVAEGDLFYPPQTLPQTSYIHNGRQGA
jgi:hypothetical protein